MLNTFVNVICDYGPGDMAFAEVISALARYLPDSARWHITSVGSFDTISTGFVTAQLGLQSDDLRPEDTIVFANCAPRQDRSAAKRDNEGEGLLYGLLRSGVKIMAVNSGYSMSFIRDDLKELWSTKVSKGSSQFRSRDFFPHAVGKLAHADMSILEKRLNPKKVIPARPAGVVGYIDSFGNIKTTYRSSDKEVSTLKAGQRVAIEINGVQRTVTVATGSFNVQEGDIALAPGSSGHDNRYWEIFQRGGDAWRTYKKPGAGALIKLLPIKGRR